MYSHCHQTHEKCEVYWLPLMAVACTQLMAAGVVTMLLAKALPRMVEMGAQVSPMKVAAYA